MALVRDDHIVKSMESRYLKNKAGQTYIACEDLDFSWTKAEMAEFVLMWREGKRLDEMSRHFNRPPEELLILALDRGMNEKIGPRQGGLIGG